MARESKPFRDRNPVIIGAVSLSVIAAAGVPRLQRAVAAADRWRHVYRGVLRGGRSPARRPGPGRGREGRQGREPGPGETAHVMVEFRVVRRLRRRPVRGGPSRSRRVLGAKYLALVPAGQLRARPRQADPARPDGVPRTTWWRRSPTCRRRSSRSTPRSSPTSFEVLSETFADTPEEVRTSLQGLAPALGHHPSRDAAARSAAVGHASGQPGAGRPQRRVHAADRRLQHAAHRGAGASGS